MALTDNCDLFAAVHEEGMNRAIEHIMRQRPSWFNFATADIAADRELWCEIVPFIKDVTKHQNPLFTILPPLPVIGADSPPVTLGFVVQLVKAMMDFHPGNVVDLPPELSPPLTEQSFALQLRVCGAIACPSYDDLRAVPVVDGAAEVPGVADITRHRPPPVHVPGRPSCFCLEVFVVGGFDREFLAGQERLVGHVDGVEIVDIEPNGLEESMECYLKAAVILALRQKFAIPLQTFFVEFPLFNIATVALSPTPNPPVPHNPAIEEHQLKAFVTMTVTP